jgi:hypothetical protein
MDGVFAYNAAMSQILSSSRRQLVVSACLLIALVATTAPAQEAPPYECAGGIFEVRGLPLLPDATSPDALIVESGTVATASGCPPTPIRTEVTPLGTVVRAHWEDCGAGVRDVQLDALMGPYCERMTGVVVSDDLLPAGEFYAALCEGGDACLQTCRSNDDCPATDLCERVPGTCRGPGLCRPVPPLCAEAPDLVCGCDGVTYLNECERRTAGATAFGPGACAGSDR